MRVLIGVLLGLAVGLVVTALVVLTKFGPLVNTPRATHGAVLVALFAVPAIAGGVVGFLWRRGGSKP